MHPLLLILLSELNSFDMTVYIFKMLISQISFKGRDYNILLLFFYGMKVLQKYAFVLL